MWPSIHPEHDRSRSAEGLITGPGDIPHRPGPAAPHGGARRMRLLSRQVAPYL